MLVNTCIENTSSNERCCIRGYQVYEEIWIALTGEELQYMYT